MYVCIYIFTHEISTLICTWKTEVICYAHIDNCNKFFTRLLPALLRARAVTRARDRVYGLHT